MKRYVSFIGSLLFEQLLPNNPSEEQKKQVEEMTEQYCTLASTLGERLTSNGHLVKVGSFSELDMAFATGAIAGANGLGEQPGRVVYQIIGGFTDDSYLHPESAHLQIPMDDDFVRGRSAFISDAKAIVLLGGHYYAKMLASWAYNLGLPLFALPQGRLAGMDWWQYLISDGHRHDHSAEIFPGISRQEYEEIGIINAEPVWLAEKIYNLVEQSSAVWVKPSVLPDDMRYKPSTNHVIANSAFIVMPFTPEKADVYEAIQKACVAAGFRGFRGDDGSFYSKDLSIMSNVAESIVHSHVVIVDISDRNSNVFYEMGMADTLGKKMVILFDGEGETSFDVRGLRNLRYDATNPTALVEPLKDILIGLRDT